MTLATLTNYLQKLDEASTQPLYRQLQRSLRSAIEKRVVAPEDALPPERALAAYEQTFGDETVDRLAHGDARHLQLLREIALGRQRVVGRDHAILDRFAQRALELLIQRLSARFVERGQLFQCGGQNILLFPYCKDATQILPMQYQLLSLIGVIVS